MKIAVCFGGTYELYLKHAKIFDKFDKEFTREDNYVYKYNNHELKVFFALGPKPSKTLEYVYKEILSHGETIPSPASVVVKDIKKYKPDYVAFFGITGGINANLNQIFYPTTFYQYYFKKPYLIHEQNVVPRNKVVIKNLFGNHKVRVLTTNLFFTKHSTGVAKVEQWKKIWHKVDQELRKRGLNYKHYKEAAKKWSEIMFYEKFLPKLKKHGDLVDMESYIFAKEFKDNIGIMLQVSDVIGKIQLTFKRKYVDWKKFNKHVILNLKKILT